MSFIQELKSNWTKSWYIQKPLCTSVAEMASIFLRQNPTKIPHIQQAEQYHKLQLISYSFAIPKSLLWEIYLD